MQPGRPTHSRLLAPSGATVIRASSVARDRDCDGRLLENMPFALRIRAFSGAEATTGLDVTMALVAMRSANPRAALTRRGVSRKTMATRTYAPTIHRVQTVRAAWDLAGAACCRGVEAAGGGGAVAIAFAGADEGHEAQEWAECA